MDKREKMIDVVKKLLAVANDQASTENEVRMAALEAQKLMAKYDIEMVDLDGEQASKKITEEMCDTTVKVHASTKWKLQLAAIIADNFRCKAYTCGTRYVVFYGHESDAKVAKEVFKFLFEKGTALGMKYYRQLCKEGKNTRGAANTYLIGYCKGIEDVLSKQCTALMIITSPEVEEGWKEKSRGMKSKSSKLNCDFDPKHYEQGRTDGRHACDARTLEGGK